jgi:hypothetical protein
MRVRCVRILERAGNKVTEHPRLTIGKEWSMMRASLSRPSRGLRYGFWDMLGGSKHWTREERLAAIQDHKREVARIMAES